MNGDLIITLIKAAAVIILSPIVGLLLAGLERKFNAFLQGRVGPPILQPWYDFKKLMSKENFVVNKYQNLYILFYIVFVVASLLMLVFEMDLLMIIFVFTIANVALIVGSMSTGSPFSRIASSRETVAMLSYEPILVLFIIGIYMVTGSFNISAINSVSVPLIFYLPLIFISMLFIMIIKFKKSPFDLSTSHHAHQELVKGMFTDFSGPTMGIIELTHWYEYPFLLGLMFLFWKQNIVMGIIIAAATYIFVILIDNISARLSWQWLIKYSWTIILGLSIVNILFLYLNNIKLI